MSFLFTFAFPVLGLLRVIVTRTLRTFGLVIVSTFLLVITRVLTFPLYHANFVRVLHGGTSASPIKLSNNCLLDFSKLHICWSILALQINCRDMIPPGR